MARVTHSPAHGPDYVMPVLGAAFSLEEAVEDALDSTDDLTVGILRPTQISLPADRSGYIETGDSESWLLYNGNTNNQLVGEGDADKVLRLEGNSATQSGNLLEINPKKTGESALYVDANGLLGFAPVATPTVADVSLDRTGVGTATLTGALTVSGAVSAPNTTKLLSTLAVDSAAVNASVVLVDSGLSITVAAGGVYAIEALIYLATDAAADVRYKFVTPGGGPTGSIADTYNAARHALDTDTVQTVSTGTDFPYLFKGIVTFVTGGTFKIQFAQGTSNATDTKFKAGSYLLAQRLS
jgi:hypothetical protein